MTSLQLFLAATGLSVFMLSFGKKTQGEVRLKANQRYRWTIEITPATSIETAEIQPIFANIRESKGSIVSATKDDTRLLVAFDQMSPVERTVTFRPTTFGRFTAKTVSVIPI